MRRVFTDAPLDSIVPGDKVNIPKAERIHLAKVLRVQSGDKLTAFDGHGRSVVVTVMQVNRKVIDLQASQSVTTKRANALRICLATAVPKGERFRWLVEKATELGVRVIQPLRTARSVVHPGQNKIERLRSVAIAACKQSDNDFVPEIREMMDWNTFLSTQSHTQAPASQLLVADPNGHPISDTFNSSERLEECTLGIGPEGGWDEEELQAALAVGAKCVQLGSSILRIETAAIVGVATLQLEHGP